MSSTTIESVPTALLTERITAPQTRCVSLAKTLVLAEEQMEQPHLFDLANGLVAAFSTRSPGKDTANEDAAAIVPLSPTHAVLIVADGLGGHAVGEQASLLAVSTIVEYLREIDLCAENDGDLLRPAILNGIEAANQAVLDLGGGAATTLAITEIQGSMIRSYHVGDSAMLLTGQRGKVKQRTIPHSPVGYAVEAGLINEEDAIHHEDRHVISNVIGADTMRIEIGPPTEMAQRDTLLLATDGLFDNLFPDEIVDHIRKGMLAPALGSLADQALQRMRSMDDGTTPSKPDDLTMLAFRLG